MKLVAALFAGFAVLLWLVWVWLGVGEASVWELLGSLSLAIVIVAGAAWLLSVVITGQLWEPRTWRRALPVVLVLGGLAAATLWLAQFDHLATEWLALRISRMRGRAINPRSLDWVFPTLRWGVFTILAFVTIAPLTARDWRMLRSWRYWALAAALLLAGVYVPWKLMTWVPAVKGLTAQSVSMGVRFGVAYVISVAALAGFGALLRRQPVAPPVPTA